MKKILFLFLLGGFSLYLASCADDDEAAPVGGAITIAGIPATATVDEGETLEVTGVTLSAEDGIQSFGVTVNGGAVQDLTAALGIEEGDLTATGTITFPTTGLTGSQTLVFTLTDVDGDSESFTHVLVIGATAPTFIVTDVSETGRPQSEISGTINTDFTFTADRAWILVGRVIVGAGATLTIEPGTIIKGAEGQNSASAVLLVARDGNIMAEGTAADPIVFTAQADEINVGEFESTLDLEVDLGLWGGVLILGNAPISADAESVQIEGIPTSVEAGLYGGTDPADNSGIFRYVSIRFTGTQLGPGNELQGLTLGGVGSGTVIDHVESINSADDGMEVFGGTVNITNFIVWGQDDDGYDIDQGWSGTIDNFVFIGLRGDHPMEIDGPEGSTGGMGTLQNGSLRSGAGSDEDEFGDLRDGAEITLNNLYFFDFPAGSDLELDADGADDPDSPDPSDPDAIENNPDNSDNYDAGLIVLQNLQFFQTPVDGGDNFDITTLFNDQWEAAPATENFRPNDTRSDADAMAQAAANEADFAENNNNMVVATPTVGADVSVLGWSLAAVEGQLDVF